MTDFVPYLEADAVLVNVSVDGSSVDLRYDWKRDGETVYEPGVPCGITNIRFASKEDAYRFERLMRTIEHNQPDVTVTSGFIFRSDR